MTFTAGAGGSVDHGGGWYDEGTNVAVAAQPAAGYRFHYWSGDVPEGEALNATATVPATQARAMQANFIAEGAGGEKIYSGPVGGLWHEASNWTPTGVPGIGDSVVITNAGGRVILDAVTAPLAACVVSNTATLLFTNWTTALLADEVVIGNKAVVTCAGPFTNAPAMPSRVWIDCTDLTLATGGKIDVAAKGYRSYAGPGAPTRNVSPIYYWGGSYGGMQGYPNATNWTYGSLEAPTDPGSGGSMGAGGGAVRIDAGGQIRIDGSILADGGGGSYWNAGGGSGGSVFLTCDTFVGSGGRVQASGGSYINTASASGGGGGGRIAVVYDPAAQSGEPLPDVVFQAAGGSSGPLCGDLGTLYFPDNQFLVNPLRHSGQWMVAGVTNWVLDSLFVSNAWVRFGKPGFVLAVTNGIRVEGSNPKVFGLQVIDGAVACGGDFVLKGGGLSLSNSGSALVTLTVGGDLVLTNAGGSTQGGALLVQAGATNGAAPGYGARTDVGGTLVVGPNSFIYPHSHGFNGGSPFFTAQRLIVERNGFIDANVKGFAATNGPGATVLSGTYAGGSYGGQGGIGRPPYGSYAAPTLPGSGAWLVAGGGLVWMEIAADVTLNGAVTANGAQSTGGSSGGGVYLTCETLAGAGGMVTANGGNGFLPSGGRAGGGGRIAIIYDPEAQRGLPVPDILFQAAGGVTVDGGGKATSGSVAGCYGDLGTLYFPDNQFLRVPLVHSGQWMVPGFTEWAVERLTMTNAWFRFPHPDFALTVTNDIVITGRDPFAHGLQVVDGNVSCGGDVSVTNAGLSLMRGDSGIPSRLIVGGDLRLGYATGGVTGGVLHVCASATNGTLSGYGATVSVNGELAVSTYATIYPVSHPTNGATALFEARDFTLAASGRVDARWRGFDKFRGPGAPTNNVSPINAWGASYGGVGGITGNANPVYGCSNAPVHAGSGGSAGVGGGYFRLAVARTLTLDGVIWADGSNGSYWNSSAGSGGGVYLVCKTFSGSGGAIQAFGGTTGTSTASGSGGGGRVAVWRRFDSSVGVAEKVMALGGPGAYPGEKGTVVWGWLVSPGTVLLLR